jgi:hypothetical protein
LPALIEKKMKKKIFKTLCVLLALFFCAELFLRFYFGFCDTVLMKEDADYEYIAAPNQNVFRFRNHIIYNSQSMRSPEVDTSSIVLLGFGDSVINGGVLTDQDSIASTILSNTLSNHYHKKVQFLNISAGSWGPDNCFAYLQKNGNYHSKNIFLVVSSHDAYDTMNFEKIVGINESFPDKQYKSALWELLDRYLLPRFYPNYNQSNLAEKSLGINKQTSMSKFNNGFESFVKYSKQNKLNLVFFVHAEESELKAGKYNDQGQEIISFAKSNHVTILQDLNLGLNSSYFRDNIHLNAKGQKLMAGIILKYVLSKRIEM